MIIRKKKTAIFVGQWQILANVFILNILYFTDGDVTINKGGVNRVIHFLSRQFMAIPGWKCHLAYLWESKVLPVSKFHSKLQLHPQHPEQQLREYIQQQEINVVLVNLVIKKNIRFVLPLLDKLRGENQELKIIFCYHTYPGAELFGIPFNRGYYYLFHRPQPVKTVKEMLLHLSRHTPLQSVFRSLLKPKYRFMYDHCDRLVVLSPCNIPRFASLAGRAERQHIVSIPNPLSLPQNFPVEQLDKKKKEVLIVARLWEPVKRISLALKIWKEVENSGQYPDWKLLIVGNGDDEKHYKTLARKLKLRNISFEGRQEPLAYYHTASIFMMTSLYEGWGLTLTESQQMGVVPIAFDAFESLHDIIRNDYNGILVPEKDTRLYAQHLMQLMSDSTLRLRLATQAIQDCQQYSMDNIIRQWTRLLSSSNKISS